MLINNTAGNIKLSKPTRLGRHPCSEIARERVLYISTSIWYMPRCDSRQKLRRFRYLVQNQDTMKKRVDILLQQLLGQTGAGHLHPSNEVMLHRYDSPRFHSYGYGLKSGTNIGTEITFQTHYREITIKLMMELRSDRWQLCLQSNFKGNPPVTIACAGGCSSNSNSSSSSSSSRLVYCTHGTLRAQPNASATGPVSVSCVFLSRTATGRRHACS